MVFVIVAMMRILMVGWKNNLKKKNIQMKNEFNSNWTTPPGSSILDIIEERDLNEKKIAEYLSLNSKEFKSLINGILLIDNKLAKLLADCFGPNINFWIRREKQYREDIKKGLKVIL